MLAGGHQSFAETVGSRVPGKLGGKHSKITETRACRVFAKNRTSLLRGLACSENFTKWAAAPQIAKCGHFRFLALLKTRSGLTKMNRTPAFLNHFFQVRASIKAN